jgi:DNA invertase Pin-like site-specific DNA recombinase
MPIHSCFTSLYAALAEKERRLISTRTKDALAARKAQGVKLVVSMLRASRSAKKQWLKPRSFVLSLRELKGMSARVMADEPNSWSSV